MSLPKKNENKKTRNNWEPLDYRAPLDLSTVFIILYQPITLQESKNNWGFIEYLALITLIVLKTNLTLITSDYSVLYNFKGENAITSLSQ